MAKMICASVNLDFFMATCFWFYTMITRFLYFTMVRFFGGGHQIIIQNPPNDNPLFYDSTLFNRATENSNTHSKEGIL